MSTVIKRIYDDDDEKGSKNLANYLSSLITLSLRSVTNSLAVAKIADRTGCQ